MSGRAVALGRPAVQFAGPPADRIAGRPNRTQAARAAKAAEPAISAATVAKAQGFLDREALLDHAINAGVIGANMRDHYAACLEADAEGTRSYLQGLGMPASPAASPQEYVDTHLSSAERQRIAAAREGRQPSRITNGGL